MTGEFINNLFRENKFNGSEKFRDMLTSSTFIKKYSKRKDEYSIARPYVGVLENICFFFYNGGYRYGSFLCSIVGDNTKLDQAQIKVYDMDCQDVNRDTCWEWVDFE